MRPFRVADSIDALAREVGRHNSRPEDSESIAAFLRLAREAWEWRRSLPVTAAAAQRLDLLTWTDMASLLEEIDSKFTWGKLRSLSRGEVRWLVAQDYLLCSEAASIHYEGKGKKIVSTDGLKRSTESVADSVLTWEAMRYLEQQGLRPAARIVANFMNIVHDDRNLYRIDRGSAVRGAERAGDVAIRRRWAEIRRQIQALGKLSPSRISAESVTATLRTP